MALMLYKFRWINMAGRYFKALAKADTRVAFGFLGLPMVIGGWVLVFTRGIELLFPGLIVFLLFGGGALMRAQAGVIEECPSKSLRNGAILSAGLTLLIGVWAVEDLEAVIGLAFGVAGGALLFVLHLWFEENKPPGTVQATPPGPEGWQPLTGEAAKAKMRELGAQQAGEAGSPFKGRPTIFKD